jgi:hypothetical protein
LPTKEKNCVHVTCVSRKESAFNILHRSAGEYTAMPSLPDLGDVALAKVTGHLEHILDQ